MSDVSNATSGTPLAAFGARTLAYLVDLLLLLVPGVLIQFGAPIAGPLFLGFFYFPIFHASPMQATIGKKAFGIKVTDTSGQPLTLQAAFLRYLIEVASLCMLCAGHCVAFFTAKRQALHDLVADSVVVVGVNEGIKPLDAWIATIRRFFGISQNAVGPIFKSGEPPKNSQDDIRRRLDELERLFELRRKGAITEEEYDRLRKELV